MAEPPIKLTDIQQNKYCLDLKLESKVLLVLQNLPKQVIDEELHKALVSHGVKGGIIILRREYNQQLLTYLFVEKHEGQPLVVIGAILIKHTYYQIRVATPTETQQCAAFLLWKGTTTTKNIPIDVLIGIYLPNDGTDWLNADWSSYL